MKSTRKLFSGAMGAAILISGAAQADVTTQHVESNVTVSETVQQFDTMANIVGKFAFSQDVVSPSDEIFSLFGTAVTGLCAKPSYELETSKANFYINVGGKIRQSYTVNLSDLRDNESSDMLLCACSTGAATANAAITGVSLQDVLSLAEMSEDINTVTVIGSDGYRSSMPLRYALEKRAMVVYRINNEAIPSGTQLWVPGTVAKYFVRDIVDIELTAEAKTPEIEQRDEALRAEVAIMNNVEGKAFSLGEVITFEGYADDCGDAIASLEFSLDGGETWTSYATEEANADRWVYWNFAYTPTLPGTYKLSVRAKTQNGNVSPLAANVVFSVEDKAL